MGRLRAKRLSLLHPERMVRSDDNRAGRGSKDLHSGTKSVEGRVL
jgi:hypothetical protein